MNRQKKRYPVKTGVNLLYREKPAISVLQVLLAAAIFVVVLGTFSKFAVIDRLAASGRALREAEELEQKLAAVQREIVDYEDVLREYQHYYFSAADGGGSSGLAYVNSLDVLELLEAELLNKAEVQQFNLTGNVLTVNLTGINLEGASAIAKSLAENALVQEVMVSAANKGQESAGTIVYLNIILEPEQSVVAGEES